MSMLTRLLSWVALCAVGAVFGLATTITHASSLAVVPAIARIPVLGTILSSGAVGIVLGVLACGGILLAVRLLLHDRWAALATGLGMLAGMVVISGTGPGGSVIVPGDLLGIVWTWTVAGMALLVVAWPDFSRIRTLQQEHAARVSAPGDGS
ncbi:histidinol dehydrogenase [Microbacterium capsulatum]|uniref:Histidinol dehydrogenase n=1 Tax=Microbacterium capsulatum TaxID=3041921 RepID=A0ABU0XFU7_9MICO|nr:histidinol dehydrogenase [Microbacterium sp. ASV81]MDQ4213998.1 histidinol dehydrogenase [Microbacterium sp. ASV81]